MTLEDYKHDKITPAVAPFLQDVNETARFHAVATTLAQGHESSLPALLAVLPEEESFRIKNKVADGIASRGWSIPDDLRAETRKHLPPGFSIDGEGRLKKREGGQASFGIDL